MKKIVLVLLAAAVMTVSPFSAGGLFAGSPAAKTAAESGVSSIHLPPGFSIQVLVQDIPNARSMTLSPGGVLYVGTRSGRGNVYAVTNLMNGKPEVVTIAEGLHEPNGVAFRDGALYVAEVSRILRLDNIEQSLHNPPKPVVITSDLPDREAHGWKFIKFGPDGKLYVPVGMPCNICEEQDKRFGTILRYNPDGQGMEIFASGIRNTVGFDWDPATHELWFTDNGRDMLGDDLPPDELDHAPKPGMNFGFPYCYGKNHPDPKYNAGDCANHTPAEVEFQAHVAALGMRFYTGKMFPEKYRNGIFVAQHGSWNRTRPIGYRVEFVKMQKGQPVSHEIFAEGWLQGSVAWGRPVDVQVMPDGSLLVSDDKAGAIYRISYKGR